MNRDDEETKRNDATKESIIETRKLESYAEHVTKDMHPCHLCHKVCYKERPTRKVGSVWMCLDCLKELKGTLDDLDRWENEMTIKRKMQKQMDRGLGLDDG